MKILIAGAGIGGLTAALCCWHFGHDVMVFERADDIGEVGAGIQIPPNAMKVFQALGIAEHIAENAFRPEAIEARMGKTGRHIFTIPLAEHAETNWGAPYLHIHRADYIAALKACLLERAPGAIELGAGVVGFDHDGTGVRVKLKDGRRFTGDILIGADGIHSAIREGMFGPDKPVFTGNVAWRAVVPIKEIGTNSPNPTACVWMGKGRHAVTYRLRGGVLANFVGVVERSDWQLESWTEPGKPEELARDFLGWHPVISNLIQSVQPENLFRWALFDRPPLMQWVKGRVALLGDAAHPMLPFLAQGAAMAVEDAWVLAREISNSHNTIAAALESYQDIRFNRTSEAQAGSRANMKIFHRPTRLRQIATYGPMWLAGRFAPSAVHRRMDWLYGHDVTKAV